MGVVEGLVMERDGIVRGATVRVITKGKPGRLSRPVPKKDIGLMKPNLLWERLKTW